MQSSNPGAPAVAAVIPGKSQASSMSFHKDGRRLYVAFEGDARLQVIDCLNGKAEHVSYRVEREEIHIVEST